MRFKYLVFSLLLTFGILATAQAQDVIRYRNGQEKVRKVVDVWDKVDFRGDSQQIIAYWIRYKSADGMVRASLSDEIERIELKDPELVIRFVKPDALSPANLIWVYDLSGNLLHEFNSSGDFKKEYPVFSSTLSGFD
ncbi:hypothetical protein [Pontibacter sp. G13]|uniref:hypothetical protein n=1 Tax=Pontibacter sp. G13 TaxID=3074898 RepID=UPI00288A00CD|nr:hypothetical protein [Pontibacter sp. G13]WNJ18888.1 hypothetical protein RJD25_00230 [Pontibacter sp. G13]